MNKEFYKQLIILMNNLKKQSSDLLKAADRTIEIQTRIINAIQAEVERTRKEERKPEART
jgi:hypothetical protein